MSWNLQAGGHIEVTAEVSEEAAAELEAKIRDECDAFVRGLRESHGTAVGWFSFSGSHVSIPTMTFE